MFYLIIFIISSEIRFTHICKSAEAKQQICSCSGLRVRGTRHPWTMQQNGLHIFSASTRTSSSLRFLLKARGSSGKILFKRASNRFIRASIYNLLFMPFRQRLTSITFVPRQPLQIEFTTRHVIVRFYYSVRLHFKL